MVQPTIYITIIFAIRAWAACEQTSYQLSNLKIWIFFFLLFSPFFSILSSSILKLPSHSTWIYSILLFFLFYPIPFSNLFLLFRYLGNQFLSDTSDLTRPLLMLSTMSHIFLQLKFQNLITFYDNLLFTCLLGLMYNIEFSV